MKKIIIAIATVIFLGVSTGATVCLHYCMGKLAGWTLANNTSGNCSKCGMNKDEDQKTDCCKNDQKIIKYTADQDTPVNAENNSQQHGNAIHASLYNFNKPQLTAIPADNLYASPPPGFGLKRYISNCVFLL